MGLGPEHSSARLERFLQLCADDNLQVANLSTPAQYFHLLRRQVLAPFRKPLVLMTPKSLLRHPMAVSPLNALTHGSFSPVLDDDEARASVKKVIFCSGKIYYQLIARRQQIAADDTAIVRVEQLYPFPEKSPDRGGQTLQEGRPMDLGAGGAEKHGGLVRTSSPAWHRC